MPSSTVDEPQSSLPTAGTATENSPTRKFLTCGCIVFLGFALVLPGLLIGYVYPLWAALQTEPSVPILPVVSDDDLWSLSEKTGDTSKPEKQTPELELSIAEFNALLTRFSPLPTLGIVIQRVRAIASSGTLILFAQGSGLWQRNLILVIEVRCASESPGIAPHLRLKQVNGLTLDDGLPGLMSAELLRRYLLQTMDWHLDDGALVDYKLWCTPEKVAIKNCVGRFYDLASELDSSAQ